MSFKDREKRFWLGNDGHWRPALHVLCRTIRQVYKDSLPAYLGIRSSRPANNRGNLQSSKAPRIGPFSAFAAFLQNRIKVTPSTISISGARIGRCGHRERSGAAPYFGQAERAQLPMRPPRESEQSATKVTLVFVEQSHSNASPSKLPFLPHAVDLVL